MALSIATTGAQIAAIQSQPEPYAKGGWIKKRKLIEAGERGPEWIASNTLVRDKKTRPVIEEMENYQRGLPSIFDQKSISIPNQNIISQAAGTISRNFASSSFGTVNNYYTTSSDKGINEMIEEIKQLRKYMEDPQNRQATINRRLLKNFDKNEEFLRNIARI